MPRPGIEVVTFDVDYTLAHNMLDRWPSCWIVAAGHDVPSREDLARADAAAAESVPEAPTMWRSDATARAGMAARIRVYLEALDMAASAWLVEMLVDDYFNPMHWRPYAEVGAALSDLHRFGVPLGVVADWVSQLSDLLVAAGIRGSFDFVLASSVFGVAKADGELYRLAVKAAGVPADRVLHVGDDPALDVEAARQAGLRAVQVDRSGRRGIPDIRHVLRLVGGG